MTGQLIHGPWRKLPAVTAVCGYPVAEIDGWWWAFRPGSKAWQRRTHTFWRPITGPHETREEAERGARRFALRPARPAGGTND